MLDYTRCIAPMHSHNTLRNAQLTILQCTNTYT